MTAHPCQRLARHLVRRLVPLALLGLVLPSPGCPAAGDRVYLPDPVTDDDPYSELSRAVRARNRSVEVNGYVPSRTDAVLAALDRVRQEGVVSERIGRLVDDVQNRALEEPPEWIDMSLVAWIGALGHRLTRSVVLVQYGDITQHEIDREEPHFRALALAANLRGYALEKQDYATVSAWQQRWQRRDVAGLVWRSEGWFSPFPAETAPARVMTRVWTSAQGEEKAKIFAASWAAVLPEGLGAVVMASCGTGGPFLADEVSILEQLGDPDRLTFDTFDTELAGHAVHLRTYRGLLATSGYRLDDPSWRALTTMLPDRRDADPDRVAVATEEILGLLAGGGDALYEGLQALAAEPVDLWIGRIIAGLDVRPGLRQCLNPLSARFTGQAQSFDTNVGWQDWWASPAVTAQRNEAARRRAAAPDEAELWARLKGDFVALTGLRPVAQKSVSSVQGCWEAWFVCAFQQLDAGTVTGDDDDLELTRTAPAHVDFQGCRAAPLPEDWTVRYTPATHRLTHNLAAVVDGLSDDDITAHCSNM